ncbi:hypothetical protein ASG17_07995 [Brevundimonas sp. Leaf363]|uniref:hypothetical protein n=1 Tax=Brevundimonas sp. Leaf363 TaxID=1736353 RepID=UPI0006FA8D49|nr:hypothetical protein [Brevundimonas sp. Leaf363]KQS55980.1 hypothetical protein ASG17_07995 [Brevundimonas sp. Leaf363]
MIIRSTATAICLIASMTAGSAMAQGASQWAKVGELGDRVTYIDLGSVRGSSADNAAVTISVSKANTDIAGEQTRWSFNCRARTYHATGYRDVEADLTMGEFDASTEPPEPIVEGSMVGAIAQSVCDGAESDNVYPSLAEAIAAARAN